jgi:hypothetical protein
MRKLVIVSAAVGSLLASAASAQVINQDTTATNNAEALANQNPGTLSTSRAGGGGLDLTTGSLVGGPTPGGLGVRMGDKVIKFRGGVGLGDDRGAHAGVGIPFETAAKLRLQSFARST